MTAQPPFDPAQGVPSVCRGAARYRSAAIDVAGVTMWRSREGVMKRILSLALLGAALSGFTVGAQDAGAVVDAAVKAMGTAVSSRFSTPAPDRSSCSARTSRRTRRGRGSKSSATHRRPLRHPCVSRRARASRRRESGPRRRGGWLQRCDGPGRHATDPRRADAGSAGDAPHRNRAASDLDDAARISQSRGCATRPRLGTPAAGARSRSRRSGSTPSPAHSTIRISSSASKRASTTRCSATCSSRRSIQATRISAA